MEQCDTAVSNMATSPPPKTAINDCSFSMMSPGGCSFEDDAEESCMSPTTVALDSLSKNVRLIVKNGEEVIIERSLLAYYSTYFRCLFTSSFKDAKLDYHRIRLISAVDVHFLFTIPRAFEQGIRPELTVQRALELLEPAAYLQIDIALEYISEIIYSKARAYNLVKLLHIALFYYTPLALLLWQRIVREFQKIYDCGEFMSLTENEFTALLSDKHLAIRSKDEKSLVQRWIEGNIHKSPLDNARLFTNKNFERRTMPDSTRYEVIRNRQPATGIVSCGGWSSRGVSQVVEIFNTRCERWQKCKFEYDVPTLKRAYHGVDIVGDELMVFGGFSGTCYYQTTVLFDLTKKTWRYGKNMHDRRCYITSAQLLDSNDNSIVYAVGGMNGGKRLRTAECYNYNQDRWFTISDMNSSRSDGALSVVDGKLMASGGFDGRNLHNSAEIYDPVADLWMTVSRPMRTRRTGCSSVCVLDKVCLVAGGFNGSRRLDSVEMYDVREGIWHLLPLMQCGRSNFGITVTDDVIYVAAGFDGQSTTKENERFDLRNQCWQALPDMNESKSALRLVQLSNHPMLDELFTITDDELEIVTKW